MKPASVFCEHLSNQLLTGLSPSRGTVPQHFEFCKASGTAASKLLQALQGVVFKVVANASKFGSGKGMNETG